MIIKLFILALLSAYVSSDDGESFDINSYRLPSWETPSMYVLTLDLRSPEKDTFRASSWIDINVTEENHYELVVNADPLYIDLNSSEIKVDTAHFICDSFDSSNVTQMMVIKCMYDMWGNNTQFAQLQMDYTAKYSESAAGLYKHQYEINGTTKYVIFSQFEPTRFRRVFPSFDEPGYKVPMRLSVEHYDNLTVASNMAEIKSSNLHSTVTVFNFTPPMPSYSLAVVAGSEKDWSYELIPGTNHFYLFKQRIHDDYVKIIKYNAPILLEKMGDWTGIKYEDLGNKKMAFAALPGMGGAMENWGLITFGDAYLVDEGDSNTTSKYLLKSLTIMAHELSHQWFGDYVTMDWWTEAWLNEGFASYFEYYLADMLSSDDNDYDFDTLFVTNILQPALQADGPAASPLSGNESDVNTASEISSCFGSISYSKGGSFLRMLRYALGEDTFKTGVQGYLKAKAYGNAKASDLIENLQAALPNDTDIDLPTYLKSWIYEPDYPIVKTSFGEADGNHYLISLDIYKYSPTLNETREQNESIWWVPISYITSDNPDPDNATYFWINPGRTFGLIISMEEGSWGIVNAAATGFYRVDYDGQTLARIISVLNNSDTYQDVATENRAQILDDQFNVAKFYTYTSEGYMDRPYENAFKVAEYLQYETEYLPWYTFLKEVQYLLDEIRDDLTKDKLKEDVLALIESQLVIPDPGNTTLLTHSEVLKISLLLEWACKLNHEDALNYVKTQFARFKDDVQSIDRRYRDVVLCYGVKHSDDQAVEYATLTNIYAKSFLPQERYDITLGMACMTNTDLLKSLLASTLTAIPPVDKQYWASMFKQVYAGSPEGLDAALYFLVNNVDAITPKWEGAMKIESLFASISSKITKPEHIKMLQNLLAQNSLKPDLVQAVKGAIDKAEYNVDWINQHGTEITSILVYNGGDVPITTTTTTTTITTTTTATTRTPITTTTTEKVSTTTPGKGINVIHNKLSIFVMLIASLLFKQLF